MNKTLPHPDRPHFSWLRSSIVALTGLTLGAMLWIATAPLSEAQNSPGRLVESSLPQGQTIATASKADLLSAVCAAVKKSPKAAPQIVRFVAAARPDLARDILRTAFRCLGTGDCDLLSRVLRSITAAVPNQAGDLTNIAVEMAPNCAPNFPGQVPPDESNFTLTNPSQVLTPGTIAGGGGQGNVVAICHNGHTIFVSPQGAENHLNNHPGDKLGPCQVTAVTNQ